MPLERNMVRFIENFSTGQRGANISEMFLALGYVVILIHRKGSKTPFAPFSNDHDIMKYLKVVG